MPEDATSQNGNQNNGNGAQNGAGANGNGANGSGDGNGNGAGAQNSGSSTTVDLATLSGADLEKVLENKNLWELPRVKELLDAQKKLKDIDAEAEAAEQKKLEEQGQFKELVGKKDAKIGELTQQIQTMQVNQALTGLLVKEGVVDLDAALKLVDRSKIKIGDDGTITGAEDAFNALKTDKAYLFNGGGGTSSLGAASNAGNGGGTNQPAKFKRSQLSDTAFYKEHREEIHKALAAGLIEDDITPQFIGK